MAVLPVRHLLICRPVSEGTFSLGYFTSQIGGMIEAGYHPPFHYGGSYKSRFFNLDNMC